MMICKEVSLQGRVVYCKMISNGLLRVCGAILLSPEYFFSSTSCLGLWDEEGGDFEAATVLGLPHIRGLDVGKGVEGI